jgi:para-aminobenzoate synthetase component 1
MPDGTFDFNVLIRSIFIDQQENKLTFNVGSAITLDSNPEEEYEECLLKAKAIFKVLGSE